MLRLLIVFLKYPYISTFAVCEFKSDLHTEYNTFYNFYFIGLCQKKYSLYYRIYIINNSNKLVKFVENSAFGDRNRAVHSFQLLPF